MCQKPQAPLIFRLICIWQSKLIHEYHECKTPKKNFMSR